MGKETSEILSYNQDELEVFGCGQGEDEKKWAYVNLKTGETEIHSDTSEWIYTDGSVSEPKAKETIGIEWHIAIHRYEIKTNGGMVFDTEKTNMNEITELPEGDREVGEGGIEAAYSCRENCGRGHDSGYANSGGELQIQWCGYY